MGWLGRSIVDQSLPRCAKREQAPFEVQQPHREAVLARRGGWGVGASFRRVEGQRDRPEVHPIRSVRRDARSGAVELKAVRQGDVCYGVPDGLLRALNVLRDGQRAGTAAHRVHGLAEPRRLEVVPPRQGAELRQAPHGAPAREEELSHFRKEGHVEAL